MKMRLLLAFVTVVMATLGMAATVPAQTPSRKVLEITASSFKF